MSLAMLVRFVEFLPLPPQAETLPTLSHTSCVWRTSRHIAPKPKKNGQRARALPDLVPDTGSDSFARALP